MLEEVYSTFPEGTTDEDIFDMLLTEIKAVCCSCKTLNIIKEEGDEFKCTRCGTVQYIPMLNPEEFERRK